MFIFIIFGPPGSGKSTQADILANKFGLVHFNTGEVIEKTVFNPVNQDDPEIKKQRELFKSGQLCNPEWVVKISEEEIEKIHRQGKGMVFSGAMRTLYEAENMMPFLEKLYGKENVYIFDIEIPEEVSIFRNTHRRICKQCGLTLIYNEETSKLTRCPHCGGELVERVLDNKETIVTRLKTYHKETEPVLKYFHSKGIKVFNINGTPMPDKVAEQILSFIKENGN